MEVDEEKKKMEEEEEGGTKTTAEEEELEELEEPNDDDRDRLTEVLEWLGLAASLSSPSVTLVESEEGRSEEEEDEPKSKFVDVCSFEGLLGSNFAAQALRAAAAAVAASEDDDSGPPWAALVLVGFPDSPLAWTKGVQGGGGSSKKTMKGSLEPVRLGPEACREHSLFVVVVKEGSAPHSPPVRVLAAVASGGGDGFSPGLLL